MRGRRKRSRCWKAVPCTVRLFPVMECSGPGCGGECPRCYGCGHEIDDRQTLTAVTNLMGREWRLAKPGHDQDTDQQAGPEFVPVDVSCGCGQAHSGAPAGSTGCGVSFRVELRVQQAAAGGGR